MRTAACGKRAVSARAAPLAARAAAALQDGRSRAARVSLRAGARGAPPAAGRRQHPVCMPEGVDASSLAAVPATGQALLRAAPRATSRAADARVRPERRPHAARGGGGGVQRSSRHTRASRSARRVQPTLGGERRQRVF